MLVLQFREVIYKLIDKEIVNKEEIGWMKILFKTTFEIIPK